MTFQGTSDQAHAGKPLVSVVIPVFNERAVLPVLHQRLADVFELLPVRYELVLVDDGSTDGSGQYMVELAQRVPGVRSVRLSRNFGKEAALTAGIEHARGDAVIVIDADLQDPPELIPQMLDAWQGGADVVAMKRRSRAGETVLKRWSAYLFYRLLSRISAVDIPRDTGDFRLMSRKAVEALSRLPERNRYMKGLFAWIGLPTTVIEYDRASRAAGNSQWDYLSLLRLAFEGITSFSVAPLRLAMVLGALIACGGVLFGAWIILKTLVLGEIVPGYPSMIALMTVLGGTQLLSIGLLGEYVGKIYFEAKQRPVYLVRDITCGDSQEPSAELNDVKGARHVA